MMSIGPKYAQLVLLTKGVHLGIMESIHDLTKKSMQWKTLMYEVSARCLILLST